MALSAVATRDDQTDMHPTGLRDHHRLGRHRFAMAFLVNSVETAIEKSQQRSVALRRTEWRLGHL